MRFASISIAGVCTVAIVLFCAAQGSGQAILQQIGFGCTDPVGNMYCQMDGINPCNAVPQQCFDYFRWFTNAVQCVNFPGQNVASGAALNTNGDDWSTCMGGSIPGSTCHNTEQKCGTMRAYAGVNCQVATYCGDLDMEACLGTSGYNCAQ